jgi:hypothetical protein
MKVVRRMMHYPCIAVMFTAVGIDDAAPLVRNELHSRLIHNVYNCCCPQWTRVRGTSRNEAGRRPSYSAALPYQDTHTRRAAVLEYRRLW